MAKESNYTKRELDEKFREIHEKLDQILVQTTKTNGSVINLKMWQNRTIGALAVITLIVLPLTVYAFDIANKCAAVNCLQAVK